MIMECHDIIKVLTEREHYNENRAVLAVSECTKIDGRLLPLLNGWLSDAENMQDICIEGVSLLHLKESKSLNYLGALLTIDWLIKEPEIAKPIVESFF